MLKPDGAGLYVIEKPEALQLGLLLPRLAELGVGDLSAALVITSVEPVSAS